MVVCGAVADQNRVAVAQASVGMGKMNKPTTAVSDGEPLSLREWLFVWGALGGFTTLAALLLIGFGYWLGGC